MGNKEDLTILYAVISSHIATCFGACQDIVWTQRIWSGWQRNGDNLRSVCFQRIQNITDMFRDLRRQFWREIFLAEQINFREDHAALCARQTWGTPTFKPFRIEVADCIEPAFSSTTRVTISLISRGAAVGSRPSWRAIASEDNWITAQVHLSRPYRRPASWYER